MPKPSLTQKLGKRPSRSYLSGLSDAGGSVADNASLLSFRSGESGTSNRPGGRLDADDTGNLGGSINGGSRNRYSSLSALKPSRRSYAASDVGMSYDPSATSRLRASNSSAIQSSDRYSPAGDKRRSVTFGDLNPALFNERDNLEVMSDIGGYGRSKRNRTFSTASSIDGGGSDAGSTLSQSRRLSVRRGSKSEKVTQSAQQANSMGLWHNSLGGPGLVRRSEASGTVISTSNPATAIVQRKSTLSSPKKLIDRDPQPSRRYSMQPDTAAGANTNTQVASAASNHLNIPRDGRASPTSSQDGSSHAGSEASYAMRPKADSRRPQKQKLKSGGDPIASDSSAGGPPNGSTRHAERQRSTSVSSNGSKKSTRSTTSTSAKGISGKPLDLHSNTLKNNLMNMPTPPASPSKKKRTPEQVVEALAKAGLLERVMEVVQEADEEESGVSGTDETAQAVNTPRQVSTTSGPSQSSTRGAPMYFNSHPPQQSITPLTTQAIAQNSSQYSQSEAQVNEPTREELVQTPATEFATPPSTPPDTPIAEEAPNGAPWSSSPPGTETPKQGLSNTNSGIPASISHEHQTQPGLEGPLKQTDVLIASGIVPVPIFNTGPPIRLESLSALSTFDPHLVSRSLQGTVLVLAVHDLAMIFARLTWNNWANYEEVVATPISNASIGGVTPEEMKRFQFTWTLPPGTNGADVQLALRLENGSTNQAHWDNNDGKNYFAMLSPIQKRTPSPPTSSLSPTPTGSGRATPVSQDSLTAGPPKVFLVRTESDNSKDSNVLYDPNRRSVIIDGHVMNIVQGTEMHQSGIPFPTGGHHAQHPQQQQQQPLLYNGQTPARQISVETASTGSSYSVPTPTASMKDGVTSTQQPIMHNGIAKSTAGVEMVPVDRSALNTSLPPSRAQSVSSRASGDSANAPFHYPSRAGAYQASALQQQNSLRRRQSRDMQATSDMPNIMTAFDDRQRMPNGQDDLSGIYVSQGRNVSNNSITNGNGYPMAPTSDAGSVGARSQGDMSVMTVPSTIQRLNTKTGVEPFSMGNLNSGKIILPTSNSTMRAVTLTSNATQTLNRSFWRNNTQKTLRQNPKLPDHLNGNLESKATVTYSNLTPVPHKVRGDECLVQVFACAIDFWDRAKVEILHTRGQGYGFVPGRAFVGRVLECGDSVDASKVKKGDFVYGLADLRKSGALAEYITVQRGMLSQAPNGVLSLEQIAAVALSGISAFQAMDELCSTLQRGSKLIILNAHEGVGALALQLGHSLRPGGDLWMIGHYPADFSDGDSILRQLGASETLCGDPVAALQSLRESTYDAVLDTIGGRKLYDASKRILHDDGYFVTTVGDALSMPTAKANWRKSLKALFKNRDRKNIMYWFPSVDADARAALIRLREIAESGQLKPVVKRVYKFEDGPNAFQGPSEQAVIMLLDQEKLVNGDTS